jgi:hypothetical protein
VPQSNCVPVLWLKWIGAMRDTEPSMEDRSFAEFRRKVRHNELLQAAIEKLLRSFRFSGRLSVIVKNGTILKSGYEEGYFTRREDERMIL